MPDADELAFLRAIRESPVDDAPRLVFADWLDDHGQHERAEFIRVQCELEPMRFEVDRPRVQDLLQRERALESDFGLDHPAWGTTRIEGRAGPLFRRGVPELLAVSLDVLLEHGEALLSSQPTIRELVVFEVRDRADELAECPAVQHVDTLEVADWLEMDEVEALLAESRVRSRRTLRFWTDSVLLTDAGGLDDPGLWPVEPAIELLSFDTLDDGEHRATMELFAEQGRRLTILQPMLGPFLLRPDQGQNLHPGRLGDGRPVLFGLHRDAHPVIFVVFDESGRLVESWEEPDPGPDWTYDDYVPWLETAHGFRSEPVRMRPFVNPTTSKMSVRMYHEEIDVADPVELWDWVRQRKYVIDWCNHPWADGRTGEITDT